MQNSSIFFAVFLFGCAVGALLNSLYRTSILNRITAAFERELIAKAEEQAIKSKKSAGTGMRKLSEYDIGYLTAELLAPGIEKQADCTM